MDGNQQSGAPPADRGEATTHGFEHQYHTYYRLVLAVVTRKFRIPPEDAEPVVQEVFLAYLSQSERVLNVRTWLVAVACNQSRGYWRALHRTEPLPLDLIDSTDDPGETGEALQRRVLVSEALAAVPEASRRVLRMHYLEGRSAREIGVVLDTSTRYAEKLIHQALSRVRQVCRGASL